MLKYLIETPSTQTHVKKGDFVDREGVYTFNQTAGLGRLGTKWDTSKEEAICFSFKLNVNVNYPLSMIIGVELSKHLNNDNIQIKWPNDLYINDKKFCGILVEKSDEIYTVGIGINIESERFGSIKANKESLVDMIQKFVKSDFNNFDSRYFEQRNIFNNHQVIIDDVKYDYDSLNEDGSINLRNKKDILKLTDKKKIEKTLIKKG